MANVTMLLKLAAIQLHFFDIKRQMLNAVANQLSQLKIMVANRHPCCLSIKQA